MVWTEETPLTIGQIRAAMEGLPDDAQVFVDGSPDRPIVGAIQSRQIPYSNDDWQDGDPQVVGLELWLGGDEFFPPPRCQHGPRSAVRRSHDPEGSLIMPILTLQRRHAELGRIRLGHQQPITKRNGDPGTKPVKLESFRFTSPSERYITDLATLYGGTPRPWDNNGKAEFEVFTDAKTIPVIAVKGGLSQWMEFWSGGGCLHRCDGVTNVLTGEPCDTDELVQVGREQVNPHLEAKPTTRLSVMLPELEALGVWRLESHGWNAAAEIPAVAELAQYVGDLVPAHLNLMERRAIKDGKTSRFVVPVLDLQIGSARLREVVSQMSGGAAAIGGGAAPAGQQAIEAGPGQPEDLSSYYSDLERATTGAEVLEVFDRAKAAGILGGDVPATHPLYVAIGARGRALSADGSASSAEAPVDAVVVDDQPAEAAEADPDVVWQQILATAGDLGANLSTVTRDFEQRMALAPGEASAGELAAYLQLLRTEGLDVQVPA